MFVNCINTKKQGDVGLGQAIGWFTSQNYTVCLPLTDSQDYDLIVEKEDVLSRVQVKTTSYKTEHDIFSVMLKTCGGNQREYWAKKFDNTRVEILFVLTSDGDMYCIPAAELKSTNSLNLGKAVQKFRVRG